MTRKPGPPGRPLQLPLFAEEADPAGRLEEVLAGLVREPLRVILTENRSSVITSRRTDGGYQVRLHRVFAAADAATLRSLARFIRKPDAVNRRAVGDYIRRHHQAIRSKPTSRSGPPLESKGAVYDLEEMLAAVAAEYGIAAAGVGITWGRRTRKRRYRVIRFGSYDRENRVIRLHPMLDHKSVPRFFVEYIVYHELLHAVVPEKKGDGRNYPHHAEFKRQEQRFKRYREALLWEKEISQRKGSRRGF